MKYINNGYRWVESNSRLARANAPLFILIFLLLASPLQAQLRSPESWQSELLQDHELVGRIWSEEAQSFISVEQFAAEISSARYLLLGEKHDNPDHHAIQQAILEFLLDEDSVQSLTLEMLDESVAPALIELFAQETMDETALKSYLQWDDEGWEWNFYGPMILAAYGAQIDILAGNISRATVGAVYGDENAIDVSGILSAAAEAQLLLDIDESHCGQLPESQFPAMFRVQQARDQMMANSMAIPAASRLSILIAGNYHVRQDLGVPNYLAAREPDMARSRIIAVAPLEVQAGETDPNAYQEVLEDQPAYDYLWFTPALTSEDYCASLQQ